MIEELTLAQEKQLEIYRDKWVAIGLSVNRIDRPKAIENFMILNSLVLGNKKKPVVVFMDSPLTTWLATIFLYSIFKYQNNIWSQVWSQVESQVRSQVWSQVESQVRSQVGSQVGSFVYPYLDGNFMSSYFSFYDFCNKVLKISFQNQRQWDCYLKTSEVSLIYPFEDFIVISEKPTKIKMKNMILHNENGMAVEYSDGFGVYSLNGVRVTKEIVETPAEQLDPQLILKEQNAEIRREIVRKIGIERVCQKLGAKTIDKKYGYELVGLSLGDNRIRPYLKMINPSTNTFHLEGISPEIKTIDQALTWRNRLEKFEEPVTLT